jgi:hypothetical protein
MNRAIGAFSLALLLSACVTRDGNIEKPGISHSPKTFYIKAFDGLLEFPAGFYFDTESSTENFVRFSNGGIYDADLLEEPNAVIRVGKRDKETLATIDAADMKSACYGFRQTIQSIDMGSYNSTITMFYDEEMYVSIVSDSAELWFDALRIFRKSHNDQEGKCLGR